MTLYIQHHGHPFFFKTIKLAIFYNIWVICNRPFDIFTVFQHRTNVPKQSSVEWFSNFSKKNFVTGYWPHHSYLSSLVPIFFFKERNSLDTTFEIWHSVSYLQR
jgi:hypothetical protein